VPTLAGAGLVVVVASVGNRRQHFQVRRVDTGALLASVVDVVISRDDAVIHEPVNVKRLPAVANHGIALVRQGALPYPTVTFDGIAKPPCVA
jgi:hypothetical protein